MFDIRELGRRPGAMRKVSRTVPAPADLGLDVAHVPAGSDLVLALRLESVIEGVLVSGTARAGLAGECVRCLDPVGGEVVVDIQELFLYTDEHERAGGYHDAGGASADGETGDLPRLQGDLLDLEPTLRDAVVTALPWQPLCRDDCPGLCPQCGARLADDPGHGHDAVDSRWAALQDLVEPTSTDDEKES